MIIWELVIIKHIPAEHPFAVHRQNTVSQADIDRCTIIVPVDAKLVENKSVFVAIVIICPNANQVTLRLSIFTA